MTREEAIKYFESLLKRFEEMYETETSYWGKAHTETTIEATRLALSALRPVSREQVEKVWRGEWNDIKPGVLKPNISWVCRCAKCGCPQDYKHNFCPNCGAAQTDAAISMVMERFGEVLEDERIWQNE